MQTQHEGSRHRNVRSTLSIQVVTDGQRKRSKVFTYAIQTPITPFGLDDPQVPLGLVCQSAHQHPIQYLNGNDAFPSGNQAVFVLESIKERR
jgi:hypothetical protein